jgi:beta-lactamase class A
MLRIAGVLALIAAVSGCAGPSRPAEPVPSAGAAEPAYAALEAKYHARLGLYGVDTGSGRTVAFRADERFAHASTYKALLVGVLLGNPATDLDRVVHYGKADLLEWAPITSTHLATGMTNRDLMAAAIEHSDNTAANLLQAEAGGPAALQRSIRRLGDATTNTDRTEPTLNDAGRGDVRDTSTPRGLGNDLDKLVLGPVLPADRRALLSGWLVGNTTGGPYIRAAVPRGWRVGDKTGNGGYGTRNDIAVLWPPTGAPIVLAVESDRGVKDATSNDALIAEATKAALAQLRPAASD